jgi:hypothetical protein
MGTKMTASKFTSLSSLIVIGAIASSGFSEDAPRLTLTGHLDQKAAAQQLPGIEQFELIEIDFHKQLQ